MNALNICFGIFMVVVSMVALLRIYKLHVAQRHVAGYRSQTMCRSCGSITARSKAYCLHCGKALDAA